jgi:hypothetical protein
MSIFGFVLIFIPAFVIAVYLATRSGDTYSSKDVDAHATNYANVVRESHGPLTIFLYVSYVGIVLWSVIYLVRHWREFSGMFGP